MALYSHVPGLFFGMCTYSTYASVVVHGNICNHCVRVRPVCNEGKVLLSLYVCMYTCVCVVEN